MASWHLNELKYALGLSGLFSFYGIVSLIVWFAGDKLNYPVSQRVVIIALVLLTLPFALIINYVTSRKKRKEEVSAESQPRISQPQTEISQSQKADSSGIVASIEEVLQFLQKSGLDAYSLPWYLVVGNNKSGKTSLILGSNLNFQALPSQRQSELKFIRPTRKVEWRVSSEAVFIDTLGRYQSENNVDVQEWLFLLETIKKYRPQRPIDGMIVAASIEKITLSDEKQLEEQAKILRMRTDEAIKTFGVLFPVYVVFTHADSIEGFRDSFSSSQKEGQKLVWGSTISLDKSSEALNSFDTEFDILQASIMKRRLFRLSAPFPPIRQLRIFNFPLHFATTKRKIGHFITAFLRPNPFSENPLFRGFYFTAVPVNRTKLQGGDKTLAAIPHTVGETYFTERLFKDVILRDKNLVATILAQKQKPPIWSWVFSGLALLLMILFLFLSLNSLYQNKVLLDSATKDGEKLLEVYKTDAGRDLFAKNPDEALFEITAIENLRKSISKLDEYERNGAPWWMRFGLYSGNRIYKERLLSIYFNAIEQRFKKPVMRKLEEDLQKFSADQLTITSSNLTPQQEELLGKNYDLLKAYLMLSGKDEYRKYAESSFLVTTLSDYWKKESKLNEGLWLLAEQQLEFWAKQIDRDEFPFSPVNDNLVTEARKKLQAYPAWQRYYKRKITEISKQLNDRQGDITVANILARNGANSEFLEGTYRVPNAFTIEGFRLMDEAIKNANSELGTDDWVMGKQETKLNTQGVEASLIQERYFRDYTDEWRKFVKNINIKKYSNQSEAERALEEFASANSPLKILIKEIATQTNLSNAPKSTGWLEWIMKWFRSEKNPETGGNTQVEKDFRPLFTFVEGENIAKYENVLQTVLNRFRGLSADQIAQIAKDLSQDKDVKLKLRDSENAILNLLGSFNDTPSGQELANVLKRPLGNLRDFLGVGVASQIKKIWTEQILPKAKDVERGYPFEDTGDADMTKLSVYLNPVDGELSKFYNDRLAKFFEETDGKLKVKENSEVKFSDEFVEYLNNAFRLRETLFGKNKTPSFSYEFKLQKTEGSLVEVTIDGQKIDSSGTGSTNLKFPATSGETGVLMNLVSTTGATTSANLPENTTEQSSSKRFPGTWGLLKFFEAGSPKKNPSGEYVLTYRLGNKTVSASIRPTGGDLFNRNIFKSIRAPQNILKQ